jgi:hypothetical protein
MIVEIASFKLLDSADEKAFLAAHKGVHDTWVKVQPGFISRDTYKDTAGNWRDVVIWDSIHHATQAAERIMQTEEAGFWMQMMDQDSVQMYHGESVMSF